MSDSGPAMQGCTYAHHLRLNFGRETEFQVTQKPQPYSVSEQKQPAVAARGFSPIHLPFVVHAKEIVFSESVGAGILEDQVEEHVARRICVEFWIVTDLYAVDLV